MTLTEPAPAGSDAATFEYTYDMIAAPLPLPPSLDITAAEDLCRALLARLADGDIALDGTAVENVSTPCLQVLAAAAASAGQRGQRFRLHGASAALRGAITDLGLHAAIPLED